METPSETHKKIEEIQEMVRRHVPDDKNLVDELIAERLEEEMDADGSEGE